MELINQNIHTRNFAPATGAFTGESSKSVFEPQPLFGLGIAYDLGHETSLYANVSQSYRTPAFSCIQPASCRACARSCAKPSARPKNTKAGLSG